ncbi:MAG: dihydrolipoamide acetyltransferase family protein [Bacteroidota bacterium]
MSLIEIIMPKMGESIMEATVLKWLKNVGERIEVDEYLLEVATDKIDTEVPSSHTGIVAQILVPEGEVAEIGKPICIIETEGIEQNDLPKPVQISEKLEQEIEEIKNLTGINLDPIPTETPSNSTSSRFYSPLVLSICKEENISHIELENIAGSGADGRVTKHDIFTYLENRTSDIPKITFSKTEEIKAKPVVVSGNDEIIQMDRMRKMIADRMVDSVRIAPHVTSFVETDMTNIAIWRNGIKDSFKKQYGENITYTPILVEAIVKAIKDFPQINASVEGDKIIVKRNINIGMAVALPSGNLIVPVIHQADSYNLVGLTKKINDLSKRARENKLKPEDLEGGTYTFSNIGTFGNIMGTPIIVQPQVAIMAFGAIQKKPAVIETPQGDLLGIRQKMFISHSYDHRVVDGSLGGQFVKRVSDYLEGFEIDRKLL